MLIPLHKPHNLSMAKAIARQLSRLTLHSLLDHSGGITVSERLRRLSSGAWERVYMIRLKFENVKRIESVFRVTAKDMEDCVRRDLVPQLIHSINLEQRRAGNKAVKGLVASFKSACNEPVFATHADDDAEEAEGDMERGRGRKNGLFGVDDDAEEEEDVEEEAGGGEDDDGEQGTLRFGTKKEVSGYEEDEADGDGEEEEKNQNDNGIDKLAVDKNASHNTNGINTDHVNTDA